MRRIATNIASARKSSIGCSSCATLRASIVLMGTATLRVSVALTLNACHAQVAQGTSLGTTTPATTPQIHESQ